jgi:DNA-binding GntR family transcriptional regulator
VFHEQHRGIAAALQERDAIAAERLMREHVLTARRSALQGKDHDGPFAEPHSD